MIKKPKFFISLLSRKKGESYIKELGNKGSEALNLIQKTILLAGATTTVELILEWLKATEYWQRISWEEELIIANWLEKVSYMERELGWSKQEISEYFEEAEKQGHRERNLKTNENKGILISTVHQAKGLEYPIVFLADLQRKIPPRTSKLIISSKGQLSKKVLDEAGNWQYSYSFKKHLNSERELTKREKWRLFYVALTRAQKTIYLIGCGNSFNKKKLLEEQTSWWGLILKLRYELINGLLQDEKLSPLTLIYEDAILENKKEQIKTNISQRNELKTENRNVTVKYDWGKPWSVSSLADLAICRRKFYYRYILKIPEIKYRSDNSNTNLYGIFIHKILENWEGSLDLKEVIIKTGARYFIAEEELQRIMTKTLQQFQKLPRDYLFPPESKEIYKEVPINYSIDENYVFGVIDRLIIGQDQVKIIDYKTDAQANLEYKHIVQLELYALGVKKILETPNISAEVLFIQTGGIQPISIDKEILSAREEWLADYMQKIKKGIFKEDFYARESGHCYGCNYKNICRKNKYVV